VCVYFNSFVIYLYNGNRNYKNFKKIKMELFERDYGVDNSELDNTQITTMLLYFSTEEMSEFKRLCKIGIKKVFGEEAINKGNITDFLIKELKEKYDNN